MAAAVESPVSLCSSAEQALLLSDFTAAEACARRCLAAAAGRTESAAVQERALVVALQALYETQRLGDARQLLHECYAQLEDAPPNALLVWISLAVDSQEDGGEAKRLTQSLLASRQPGGTAGWTRQQYLTLLHLHVCEVLLAERGPAEAARWVEGTQLPLTPAERQLLLDELSEQQQLPSGAAPASSRAPAAAPNAVQPAADGARERAHRSQAPAGAAPPAQQRAQPTGAGAQAPAAGVATAQQRRKRQQQQQGEPEIVPASEEEAAVAGAAGSEPAPALAAGIAWLCQAQQQALQAAGAWLRPLLGHPSAEQQGAAAAIDSSRASPGAAPSTAQPSPDPLPLLGGTVLGAVLLYALYAERQALRRGVRRARRAVAGGLADLLRMALSRSINPLASTQAWG